MPIYTQWDSVGRHVLRQTVVGLVSPAECRQAIHALSQQMLACRHIVHLILDLSQTRYAAQCDMLALARYADYKLGSNIGLVVVVSADPTMKSMIRIAANMAPRVARGLDFVNNLVIARALIFYRGKVTESWSGRLLGPSSTEQDEG